MSTTNGFKESRIGKAPITVPSGVDVKINGSEVTVKGPKGSLTRAFPSIVGIAQEENILSISITKGSREHRAKQGLTRALLANMVTGVSAGFERTLEVIGVGYRADKKGNIIIFQLGYSHPIWYELPDGVDCELTKDNKVILRSINKETLGMAAAKIRSLRPPEPYKGKGVKYAEETIMRKAGKAAGR